MLCTQNLCCQCGGVTAANDVCFSVDHNGLTSITGPNGAGKTTTLRSIMGLTPPRSGNIFIDGQETTRWQPHKVSRLGVAYVPAERHIFPGLSVEENLHLAARPGSGENAWTFEKVYEHFPVLADRSHQDGATMSGGQQQMLAIGRALISNPRIIIMDEPSQGLSPILVQTITDVVLKFCVQSGITLVNCRAKPSNGAQGRQPALSHGHPGENCQQSDHPGA